LANGERNREANGQKRKQDLVKHQILKKARAFGTVWEGSIVTRFVTPYVRTTLKSSRLSLLF